MIARMAQLDLELTHHIGWSPLNYEGLEKIAFALGGEAHTTYSRRVSSFALSFNEVGWN